MAFIDAHVHVWTPDTAHYPLAEGYKKEDMKPASFTPEELFKHCKPAGVDRINLIQMSFYGTEKPLTFVLITAIMLETSLLGSSRPCQSLHPDAPTATSAFRACSRPRAAA